MQINLCNYLAIAEQACQELMKTYAPSQLPPANSWHYHQGVFLYGMQRVWEKTGKEEYYEYIKAYIDLLVDEQGNFLFDRDQLDSIQVGILLFPLLERSGERRYKIAADKLRSLFYTLNKTSEGGFWHKDKYPYQMWLDGLFMAGPFALMYNQWFNQTELIDQVLYQEKLMRSHMKDDKTGLLFHAWDEKKERPWADPATGCSPEFWGRSVGWYGTALVDILELLPGNHLGREELIQSLLNFAEGLAKFQDEKTGLWYQVVDKGGHPDNWPESSCTSLFVYTLAKSVENGYIDEKYLEAARKAYQGLLDHMIVANKEKWTMKGICIGTSAGDYDYYVSRPTSENDLHGVGAFILATMALQQLEEGRKG